MVSAEMRVEDEDENEMPSSRSDEMMRWCEANVDDEVKMVMRTVNATRWLEIEADGDNVQRTTTNNEEHGKTKKKKRSQEREMLDSSSNSLLVGNGKSQRAPDHTNEVSTEYALGGWVDWIREGIKEE